MSEPDNQLVKDAWREAFSYKQLVHKGNQLCYLRLREYAVEGICQPKLVYSLAPSCNQLRTDEPPNSEVPEEKGSEPFWAKLVCMPTLQQKQA